MRHEIWQYSWNYGGWQKEKRTKVMDRVMLHRDELRKWTWLWDPKLGGIEVGSTPLHQVRVAQAVGREEAEGAVSVLNRLCGCHSRLVQQCFPWLAVTAWTSQQWHPTHHMHTVCTRTTTKYATSTTAITYISHFTSRPWPASSFTSG